MVHKTAQYEALIVNNTEHSLYNNYRYGLKEKQSNLLGEEEDTDGHYRQLLKAVFLGKYGCVNQLEELQVMQLRESEHLLSLEMAGRAQQMDFSKSIDPFYFLELQEYN